jgi:hypothetical protein
MRAAWMYRTLHGQRVANWDNFVSIQNITTCYNQHAGNTVTDACSKGTPRGGTAVLQGNAGKIDKWDKSTTSGIFDWQHPHPMFQKNNDPDLVITFIKIYTVSSFEYKFVKL